MSYRAIPTPSDVAASFAKAGVVRPRIWECDACGWAHFTRQQCRNCRAGKTDHLWTILHRVRVVAL